MSQFLHLIHTYVTLSHLRSKKLPWIHSPAPQATYKMCPGLHLAVDYIDVDAKIDSGD